MKLIITLLTLFLAQKALAQKPDTIWYNNKWEKTQQLNARHYSRVVEKLSTDNYKVKDYYETGSLQMEGFFSSLEPDIKNGAFKYWYRTGKKQMDASYEDNKETQVCQYNEQGEITNEWELIPIIKMENGKLVTEFRVIQRSPKFPGGKNALNEFILKHIKHPNGVSNIRGRVIVRFQIDQEGNAVNPIIISGLSPEYNQEAINLIKKMPKWEPGKQNGKLVAITLSLPITFN
ncbi:energy transducer TonB [Pedobacter gandavensis]|uniref:energy transducer TonB n=1 Tax=Pedobacter gandavensis TaxID=2679963 RepID=UPI0029306C26|nr:energy transducer TonB [Pedobacter gandavensis]